MLKQQNILISFIVTKWFKLYIYQKNELTLFKYF